MHNSNTTSPQAQNVLTGDRPTGPLHLGYYVGSLRTRLQLQETHRQFVLVADTQALTDNAHDVDKVRRNVLEVVPVDYRDGQFTFERVVHRGLR